MAHLVSPTIPHYNDVIYIHIAGEAVDNPSYTRSNRATRFSNVYCIGNEDMLEDCRHHTIELNDGKNYTGPVAAVDCKGM